MGGDCGISKTEHLRNISPNIPWNTTKNTLIESFNIPWNINIPWIIGGILGDSPEYWGGISGSTLPEGGTTDTVLLNNWNPYTSIIIIYECMAVRRGSSSDLVQPFFFSFSFFPGCLLRFAMLRYCETKNLLGTALVAAGESSIVSKQRIPIKQHAFENLVAYKN